MIFICHVSSESDEWFLFKCCLKYRIRFQKKLLQIHLKLYLFSHYHFFSRTPVEGTLLYMKIPMHFHNFNCLGTLRLNLSGLGVRHTDMFGFLWFCKCFQRRKYFYLFISSDIVKQTGFARNTTSLILTFFSCVRNFTPRLTAALPVIICVRNTTNQYLIVINVINHNKLSNYLYVWIIFSVPHCMIRKSKLS